MYWEIVELEDGVVALRQVDDEGEPLVTIQFSDEALSRLQDRHVDIAKAMFSTGMQMASSMVVEPEDEYGSELESAVIH